MTSNKVKNVLFIGNYDKSYNRNAIFIKGMKRNNIFVYEFNIRTYNILKNILIILRNLRKIKDIDFDLILLHSPTIMQLFFAKYLSLTKRTPLIHDIFISKLQTFYYDRKVFDNKKILKFFYWIFYYVLDLFECVIPDIILLDTYNHIKFFHEKFNTPIKKFRRVLVGAQDDIFYPSDLEKTHDDNFIVGFWGTFIPVHGIEFIIKAAKILEKEDQINFVLIGEGQTYSKCKELVEKLEVSSISFDPRNFFKNNQLHLLVRLISEFDIGLGIFGESDKVFQVIPTKIYEGIAMKIPMITCESPAIKELFNNYENILLCKSSDPESLADAILELKNNIKLRERIKQNGYVLFKENCSIDIIGKRLITVFNRVLEKNKDNKKKFILINKKKQNYERVN